MKCSKKRDVESDATITVLNLWRDGNSSGEFKLDAFDMMMKWVGPEKYTEVFGEINGLVRACKDESIPGNHMSSVMDRVYGMIEYLCHCDDPELEYAGRYARKQLLLAMGIMLDG